MSRGLIAAAGSLLLLAGCSLWPAPAEDPAGVLPGRFAEAEAAAATWPDPAWWQGFAANELDRLMAEAQDANVDLAAAATRIRQADATSRIAGAPLLPTLDADGGAAATRIGSSVNPLGGDTSLTRDYDASLFAAWEVDLWGGNRAILAASRADAAAARFDRDGVALTVTSGVAETYFQILSFRDRLRIARDNLAIARDVLALVEAQVANGAASALELAQQRTQVATQEAALPSLLQSERQAVNALALLLGRPLAGFEVEAESLASVRPVSIVAGIPGELLGRRPDLLAAEARLVAADADLAAARAALFPAVNLTASYGLASDALRSFLENGSVTSLALGVTAPIFRGGQLRGQVRLSEAQREELLLLYRGAVLTAFADVEDALAAASRTTERAAALRVAAEEARRAFDLAETQYRGGAVGLLDLLDAQRTLLGAEDALAGARFDRLSSLVALYQALGGGWSAPAPTGSRPS